MGTYLAFDLGASSGRGILGTIKEGKLSLQEIHRFPNGPLEKDGSFYWDYPALLNELKNGLKKALAAVPSIDGIAIDTWGVDYAFFRGNPPELVRLPYNYRDPRTVAAAEKLWKIIPQSELYRLTGIQCMTLNTIYQLYAHSLEHPEDFENSCFLNIPDALALGLGADFSAEYSHVSTTNLLDHASGSWCWEIIDKLGLPRTIFPPVVPSCTCGGTLSAALQKELNAPALPIYKVGSHDTASAVLAVPAPEEGSWAYISAGTWALLGAELAKPELTAEAEKNGFTNEGGVGGTTRFLTNIMGSWLFQETRRVWNESGKDLSFADLENMALDAEFCSFFINPNDPGFATPGDMPKRIADFCERTGQGRPDCDSEIIRAIYDSLALYFKCKLETLAEVRKDSYACLNIVGGGTKDRLLMQLTADALNIPVVAGPVEATAIGNVLGQAIAAGEIAGVAEARQVVRDSFDVVRYNPDPTVHAGYMRHFERFKKVL